ncbi:MAG: HAD-IA family hydrolase [Candidatus Binatia bacterium]
MSHVIYDLDGVLLDTEQFYTQATSEIVSRWGKRFDWTVKANMIGRPSLDSARYLVEALDLPISAERYLEMRSARLVELFPHSPERAGAEEFTRRLHALGVPQAIATSSERTLFDLKSTNHSSWFSIFEAVLTGDDERVERGKPAPDIFIVTAEILGVSPSLCLVVEDSPVGLEAALAAGMQVVAMPDPAMDRSLYSTASLLVTSFSELDPGDLGFVGRGATAE